MESQFCDYNYNKLLTFIQIVTSFILQWRLHVRCKLMHETPNLTAFVSSLTSRQTYAYIFKGMCHNLRFFYPFRQIKRQLTDSLSVVGMEKNITLEGDDEDVVLQLMEKHNIDMNSDKMVTFHPKIMINGQEISSKYLSRVQKRNNYTAAFTHLRQLEYGRIKYFLTCPADSSQSVHCHR